MQFNPAPPTIILLDINSCFATIEQQANPSLRGKPIAVAAFTTPKGCILAASVEAKRLGIKTGMRVADGCALFPNLVVLPPDPWKYRNVHLGLRKIVSNYTNDFSPKSIDEFVLDLSNLSHLRKTHNFMHDVAVEMKQRIRKEVGEWITVSIGIAPNRYLAKVAAGIKKPDGLVEINKDNFLDLYSKLKLTDLTGIKERNAVRLNSVGIYSVLDFYQAPIWKLKAAFRSITSLYWHLRLSGYEVDDVEFARRSFGNSVAIGANLSKIEELSPILARLTEKMCSRLRAVGYKASGIHLIIIYKNGSWWHKGKLLGRALFDSRDLYKAAFRLLVEADPQSPVLNLAVSCFSLSQESSQQLEIFDNVLSKANLVKAEDEINERWGDFTISSARSLNGEKVVLDRIAFGAVKELAGGKVLY